jgi:hypothetical protein
MFSGKGDGVKKGNIMKMNITKEWCMRMAELEDDSAISAGTEVKNGEYRCAMCGGIFAFSDDWKDEEARAEAEQNGFDLTECLIICDDCYKLTPWGQL